MVAVGGLKNKKLCAVVERVVGVKNDPLRSPVVPFYEKQCRINSEPRDVGYSNLRRCPREGFRLKHALRQIYHLWQRRRVCPLQKVELDVVLHSPKIGRNIHFHR